MFRPAPRPLRIALLSVHADPLLAIGSEEAGGQNVYVREVAKALAARGHSVDVFTRNRHGHEVEILTGPGFRDYRLPAGPRGFIPRTQLFPHLPAFMQSFEQTVRLEGERYDILHSNYWLSAWVGCRLSAKHGLPLVHTHHSLGAVKFATEGALPSHGPTRLEVEQAVIAHAGIVATSPQELAIMRQHYGPTTLCTIAPCGFDDAVFFPRAAPPLRRELGVAAGESLIVYAGRFDRNKGIDTLVRALSRLAPRRAVKVALAGGFDSQANDGKEFERIQALVSELGLADRVSFLGKLAPDRLAELYSAADLCGVPSHYESFGLTALESMACGTPVVASDVGGLRHTVRDGKTGLRVPPGEPVAFAAACEQLLGNPRLREAMGQAARQLAVRQFTWKAVASQLEGFYRSLMAPERGASMARAH
ncbi:MAG TPA: glycosyltransferase [Stenomitos sp.]